ncbi:MAG: hypothetical protein JW874_14035 [Spirochaetales bacterium]|nr:hypothetical protein [Spirochaetales bacterium]
MNTKKLLANLTNDNRLNSRGKFLSPACVNDDSSGFITIDGKKEYDKGYVVYTGKEVSPAEFLAKCDFNIRDKRKALKLIGSYFKEIQNFKVGNIVGMDSIKKDSLTLKLIAQSYRSLSSETEDP